MAKSSPVSANFSTGVSNAAATAVATGELHTCAIFTGKNTAGVLEPGFVSCWGDNGSGQLGDAVVTSSTKGIGVDDLHVPPGLFFSPSSVIALSAGSFHTCALLSDSAVFCWGDNVAGEIGTGATSQHNPGFTTAAFSLGAAYTIPGQSNPCNHFSTSPTACRQLLSAGPIGVFAGADDTCVLSSTGVLQCWGQNEEGQLGDGTTTNHLNPTTIPF